MLGSGVGGLWNMLQLGLVEGNAGVRGSENSRYRGLEVWCVGTWSTFRVCAMGKFWKSNGQHYIS